MLLYFLCPIPRLIQTQSFWDAWARSSRSIRPCSVHRAHLRCSPFLFNHAAPRACPVLGAPLPLAAMNHGRGWWLLAGRSISVSDSLVATASSSYWHSSWAGCKSGRFCSESDQLACSLKSDGGTLISLQLVTTACIAGRLLGLESLQALWFSTTKQLTASEWAFPTFAKNRGCLSMCQAVGRFKKSKFNRWLVPPCLAAANGSSGYGVPTGQPEQAGEKWMNGASSRVQCRGGFFTPQLLNDFFNWFQQCSFSITDSIPAIGQKNGLRKIIGRKEKKKKVLKKSTPTITQWHLSGYFMLNWKKRERETAISPIAQPMLWRRVRMYFLAFKPRFIHARWPAPWFGTSCRKQLSSSVTLPDLFLRQPSKSGTDWRQFN